MPSATLATAQMYLDVAIRAPYIYSKFAALASPKKFNFSQLGVATLVRNFTGGNAVNYSTSGYGYANGQGPTMDWESFNAPWDRDLSFLVDSVVEMDSITQGMQLSGPMLLERSWANFGAEIDATTSATIFSQVPAGQVTTSVQVPLDKSNIFYTLANYRAQMINAGYDGDLVAFMASSVFAQLEQAIIAGFGLANVSTLTFSPSTDESLKVTVQVYQYTNITLIRVPDNRLLTAVSVFDGVSAGQTAGGWAPDTTASNYARIGMLLLPFEAAFLSIRYLVNNFLVPMKFLDTNLNTLAAQLPNINKIYNGQVALQNIGVNPIRDAFAFNSRILYGAGVFSSFTNTLFAITNSSVVVGAGLTTSVTVQFPTLEAPPLAVSAYTVTVNGAAATVDSVSVSGQVATLTLAAAPSAAGQAVVVNVTTPDNLTWTGSAQS